MSCMSVKLQSFPGKACLHADDISTSTVCALTLPQACAMLYSTTMELRVANVVFGICHLYELCLHHLHAYP